MDELTPEELHARRDLYALCARLLSHEVDRPLWRVLSSGQLEPVARQLEVALVEPDLLRRDEAGALEELAVEYCRLFIGPIPLCSPFASAQMGEALLGGRARTRLESFAQARGIDLHPDDTRIASPDHIGVELALLANLYAQAAEPRDAEDRLSALVGARELLEQHLLPWAPRYLAEVEQEARRALYRAAGKLGASLLADEQRMLS